jgi:predicted Zn-dependent protease
MRPESRFQLGIELQQECPEATASIDLLTLDAAEPLAGTVIGEDTMTTLLEESPAASLGMLVELPPMERARLACEEADRFAARGLHGEAAERYARASEFLAQVTPALGAHAATDDCADLRRRAKIGDARSRCLLGRGHELLSQLRELARVHADDVEILALLAAASAHAITNGPSADRADRVGLRVLMTSILRLVPDSAALLHFVGDAALAIADHEYAMLFYRRALTVDPSRPTPRVAIARLLRKRGDTLASQLELVAALATLPNMREARFELAQVHVLRARAADALPLLTGLLAEDPTDVESLILLGETLLALDRAGDARIAIAHARRHDPDHPRALLVEGTVLEAQGRLRDARERWQRVCTSAPGTAEADAAQRALLREYPRWRDTPFEGAPALSGARQ